MERDVSRRLAVCGKSSTSADVAAAYACAAGTYSNAFTLNLKSGTSNKIFFVCFAPREADVSFTNISLTNDN